MYDLVRAPSRAANPVTANTRTKTKRQSQNHLEQLLLRPTLALSSCMRKGPKTILSGWSGPKSAMTISSMDWATTSGPSKAPRTIPLLLSLSSTLDNTSISAADSIPASLILAPYRNNSASRAPLSSIIWLNMPRSIIPSSLIRCSSTFSNLALCAGLGPITFSKVF